MVKKLRRYPGLTLESAIKIVEEARSGGKSISKGSLATIGRSDAKGSTMSGAFRTKIAALSHFGLIEVEGPNIKFTQVADNIVYPVNEQEKKAALCKSFLSPQVFKELYEKLEHNVSIPNDLIGNLAVRDLGVSPSGKDTFLKNFVRSGKYVGLLEYDEGSQKVKIIDENITSHIETGLSGNKPESTVEGAEGATESGSWYNVDVPLPNGKKVVIKLPEGFTNDHLKKTIKILEAYAADLD